MQKIGFSVAVFLGDMPVVVMRQPALFVRDWPAISSYAPNSSARDDGPASVPGFKYREAEKKMGHLKWEMVIVLRNLVSAVVLYSSLTTRHVSLLMLP
jgi:hypothetical protein